MTAIGAPAPPAPRSDPPRGPGRLQRLWRLPVPAHMAALAVVLLALLPVLGTEASFSADEGAAIAQARSLERGEGWIVEHPVPEVDPGDRHYPLELSARGPRGVAPFAKHPLYALLLAGAGSLGGVTAMVLLSVVGTVAAAGVASALARRIEPVLSRPAVWATGLASPLFFDGYLVIAHTLGAAAAGAAVLAAVFALDRRSRSALPLLVASLVLAVLLRTEATLLGVALAAAAGLAGLARRERRVTGLVVSVVAVGSVLAARALEKAWAASLVGGSPRTTGGGSDAEVGWLAGRLDALVLTWLRPGYGGDVLAEAALVVMLVSLVLAARVARRHPQDGTAIGLLGLVAAAAGTAALVVSPSNVVPGLLVAFPLAATGMAVMGRDAVTTPTARLVGGSFALFAAAVVATQYATGGSGEWGGRYFALGLPLLVPVVLTALHRTGLSLDRATAGRAAGALVVCSVAMATMAVGSLRSSHRFTARLMASVASVDQAATPDARPVVVATSAALPRLAWPVSDGQRWLLAEAGEVADLAARLRAAGEERMVVTGHGRPPETGAGTRAVAADRWASDAGWFVVVVDLRA